MKITPASVIGFLAVAYLFVAPVINSGFFVNFVLTRMLIFGIAAATIVFLTGYAAMTSLAQLTLFGVAAFTVGNVSGTSGADGLSLGWNPWLSAVIALGITVIVAAIFGAVAARTEGIYYLMLTFIFSVIGFNFFGQVITFSGFGGITGIDPPSILDNETTLYYLAVAMSIAAYFGLQWLGDTPFGLTLQGIRDEPIRMAALGFNVPLHRTLAFIASGFVAGIAGILFVWWNGQVDPNTIGIGATIDLLIIAVIGGIARLSGAWLGSLIFVLANVYLRDIPGLESIGLGEDRFNTVVGLLVLFIVVVSPDGIVGIFDRFKRGPTAATASTPIGEEPSVA